MTNDFDRELKRALSSPTDDALIRGLVRGVDAGPPPPTPDTVTWAGDECEDIAAGLAAAFKADTPPDDDALADGLRRVFANAAGPGGNLAQPDHLAALVRDGLTTDPTDKETPNG